MITTTVQELVIRMDQGCKLTPEEYAQIVLENKPYLIEIERAVEETSYGEIDLKLFVRAGQVEKVTFYKGKVWLKEKV